MIPERPLEPDDEAFVQAALSAPFAGKTTWFRMAQNRTERLPNDKRLAWQRSQKPEVIARMAYLQQQEASRRAFTRDTLRTFLEAAIATPVGELTEESPLAQEVIYRKDGTVEKIKAPDKLKAAELLVKLNGWDRQEGETGPLIQAQMVVLAVLNGGKT